MPTTWTIAIDWDRNGNYSDIYDDVTSRVVEAQWFVGQKKAWQDIADNSVLTLVLENSDKRFSPDYPASPLGGKLQPFRPVRIQSNDGSTTRTHWIGWIESIKPLPGQLGKRLVTIIANGPMQFFLNVETQIELQENKRSDEVISKLIPEVVIPPALTSAWILGRVGFSEINQTARLANTTSYSILDTGKITFDLAADNWVRQGGSSNVKKTTYDVYQAINDVTAAERGKFLFDRGGSAIFWNRHHLLDEVTPAVTLDNAMVEMEYNYAGIEDVKNEVRVTCHPRIISEDSNQVLWRLSESQPLTIEPNSTKEFFVNYEDDSKNRVGGRDVTYTNLVFKTGSAGLIIEAKANGANLKFTNTSNKPAELKSLTIQGQKITDSGQMEAKQTDNASIIDFGRRTLNLNLPSVGSLEHAQYIADFEARRRGKPRGYITSVKFLSHSTRGGGQHTQQLARTLGDLVRIKEAQTGHESNYYIIGEMHRLFNAAEVWETSWHLEPQNTYATRKVQEIQADDLIAYWKLADESGATMYDSSGYARSGTASGVAWGQVGIGDSLKAARFDGVNDYCNPYSDELTEDDIWNGQELTISGWFKVANSGVWTDGQTRYLFSFRNQDSPVDSIAIRKDSTNNQLTCEYSANGTTKSVTVSSYSPTGWVHFAVTVSYGGDAMKFFLDGVQQGTTQTGLGQWNNTFDLQTNLGIGAQNSASNFWSGDLAHIAVWKRALLTSEIINLAKAVTTMFPWKLGATGRSNLGVSTIATY